MTAFKHLFIARLAVSACILLIPLGIFAQNVQVQGVVKDQTGEPVIGATVMQQGTTNGTITDFDALRSL